MRKADYPLAKASGCPEARSGGGNEHPTASTLPESNIAPENGWLEYYFPFGMAYFQGLC